MTQSLLISPFVTSISYFSFYFSQPFKKQATSVGVEDTTSKDFCKCCALRVVPSFSFLFFYFIKTKTPIKMMDDNEKLAYLGPGYTLFFVFIKYAIAFLSVFFLFVGVYELATNAAGTHCSNDDDCFKGFALILSMYNKLDNPESLGTQQWLNLVLILILVVMLQLLRRQKRATAAECDERDVSASDYTIMVEHVPRNKEINPKEELTNLFEGMEPYEEGDKKVSFKVTKINLTYNLNELSRYPPF